MLLAGALLLAAVPLASNISSAYNIKMVPTGASTNVNLYGISWKPDGSEALVVGDTHTVLRYRHDTGKFTKLEYTGGADFLLDVSWRPDSLYALVVGSDGAVLAYNGETLVPYHSSTSSYLYDIAWKHDSTEALIVGSGGTIMRFRDGTFTNINSGTTRTLFGASWSPLDGSATIVGANGTIITMAPDGSINAIQFIYNVTLHDFCWSPNGSMAVLTGENGIIATYDRNAFSFITRDTMNVFFSCCWRPGTDTAYISGDTGIILRLSEGMIKWIPTGLGSPLQGIEYRPQGDYLLSVGNKAKAVRYPPPSAPNEACLIENPLFIAVVVVIAAATLGAFYFMGRWKPSRIRDGEWKGRSDGHRKSKGR